MQDGSHRVGDKDGYGEGEGGEGEMGSTACGKRKASSHIEHLMHASVQRPDATNPLIQGANRGRQELGCGDFPSNGAVHGLFIHSSQDGSRSGAMGVACRVRVYRLRDGPPARLISAGGEARSTHGHPIPPHTTSLLASCRMARSAAFTSAEAAISARSATHTSWLATSMAYATP